MMNTTISDTAHLPFESTVPAKAPENINKWLNQPPYSPLRPSIWFTDLKRIFDVSIALIALALIWPLFLLISFCIVLTDGHTPVFKHQRVGKNGHRFLCYKFRSMHYNGDEILDRLLTTDSAAALEWQQQHKLKNDPRITRIGKFLRKTSCDELPQLWNVIKGDMSLIGPRPIVEEEIEKYAKNFTYFMATRPGITGLWQISGRSHTNYQRRVELDVQYVKNITFLQDMRILLITLPVLLWSSSAY